MRAFSFGGGVQSMACLVLAAERKIDMPLFIFANTGDKAESPDTLAYIDRYAKPYAAEHNIELCIVQRQRKDGSIVDLYEYAMADTNRTIPLPVRLSTGAFGTRKCTLDWKINVVAREIRKRRGGKLKNPSVVAIGISMDEVHRAKDSRKSYITHEFPLLDLRISRGGCADIIRASGLPVPPKSSCWFCPYKKKREWIEMKHKNPEMFARACELEAKLEAKRGALGKDKLYLSPWLMPLSEAVTNDRQLSIFGEDEECSGYCWT